MMLERDIRLLTFFVTSMNREMQYIRYEVNTKIEYGNTS